MDLSYYRLLNLEREREMGGRENSGAEREKEKKLTYFHQVLFNERHYRFFRLCFSLQQLQCFWLDETTIAKEKKQKQWQQKKEDKQKRKKE